MGFYGTDESNLAYDLSHFDDSLNDRKKRAEQREERVKQTRPRILKYSVSKSGSVFRIALCTAAVFAALCSANYYSARRDDMARMVAAKTQELENAEDSNALLQSKLDAKVNISYIEEYASAELGMQKITSSQKQYVSVNTESLVETEEDGSGGFFGSIKHWFADLMEYIGF